MFRFQSGSGNKTPISTIGDARGVLCLHGMTGTPFEVRAFPDLIAALVIIAAPLRMRRFQTRGVRALGRLPFDFRSYPFACIPKLKGSDISDAEMRAANPSLPAFPISAVTSLFDLMDEVRADIPSVRAPTLVIHGRQDHTVPMDDSLELTGSLGSDIIERLWLERSFHIVTLDVERSAVSTAITGFLSKHLASAGGAGSGEADKMRSP